LVERQTAPDAISTALYDDIGLDFRVHAQAAGYTDTEAMAPDLRRAIAETAAHGHIAGIITELQMHHPDWTPEELAMAAEVRAHDAATLLTMEADEKDTYQADLSTYQETAASIPDMQAELDVLRQQRTDHLTRIGRTALKGLVSFAGAMRELPLRAASTATVGVMSAVNWYRESTTERKQTIRFTAVSVAITGLAAFIASRVGGMSHMPDMIPAGYTTDHTNIVPDISVDYGSGGSPHISEEYGAVEVPDISIEYGQTDTPDISVEYGQIGEVPDIPVEYGATGIDLSNAASSSQLFGHTEAISSWPDVITVNRWNPNNHDGSLWGISKQLLQGSGVKNPTDHQIQQLVDTLRPQAGGPNGQLLEGQQLRLGPATKLLPNIS
jgi:hypothetical protein